MQSSPRLSHVDKVRASRDGHTYHEAWAARVALELLLPATTLRGVAIEGFSAEDAATGLSQEAHDIADLVRYRGSTEAASATAVEVVQFKYSVAHTALPMRAADIAKTLTKFAKTEADFIERFGRDHVERVVTYEIVTNRPFHPSLFSSVDRLRRGAMAADPDEAAQSQAVVVATGLAGAALSSFLSRLALTGEGGALAEVNAAVHRTLADWGGASDALVQMRLDGLRTLVHEKAGIAGQHTNVIDRIAVLGALGVANENDLFPTPEAFPPTGSIIDRSLFSEIVNKVDEASPPLLIHSAGGVGKTVLMQAIARHYEAAGAAVVVFDCYGAGRWRDPADSRHLPRRAFLHIANLLAGRGLCDVLLPSTNPEDLTRAFRARLVQAARTLRRGDSAARLVLVLDAIDHAAMQAGATGSQSFAHLLLQSLSISPVEGLAVVASSRAERRDQARGGALCRLFEIPAFSAGETRDLVLTREPTATDAEVAALHTRSGATHVASMLYYAPDGLLTGQRLGPERGNWPLGPPSML